MGLTNLSLWENVIGYLPKIKLQNNFSYVSYPMRSGLVRKTKQNNKDPSTLGTLPTSMLDIKVDLINLVSLTYMKVEAFMMDTLSTMIQNLT